MENVLLKKRFSMGKIDFNGTGRKANEVTIDLELTEHGGDRTFVIKPDGTRKYTGRKTPVYTELSICGNVWNGRHTDIIMGGQCLDELAKYGHGTTFNTLYRLWKHYHLNGMHAGTPEQEAAIKAWRHLGNKYDYTKACEFLKEIGLYEIPFTGKTVGRKYKNELYQYGHGWVVNDLPESVIEEIEALCAEQEGE